MLLYKCHVIGAQASSTQSGIVTFKSLDHYRKSSKDTCSCGVMVQATPQGILCSWDTWYCSSMGLLSKCLWLFAQTATVPSPVSILKQVSVAHASYMINNTHGSISQLHEVQMDKLLQHYTYGTPTLLLAICFIIRLYDQITMFIISSAGFNT